MEVREGVARWLEASQDVFSRLSPDRQRSPRVLEIMDRLNELYAIETKRHRLSSDLGDIEEAESLWAHLAQELSAGTTPRKH